MNKKLIGAILCVSIIIFGAIPAVGNALPLNDENFSLPQDKNVVNDNPDFFDNGKANLTVTILPGLHRGIKVEIKNIGEANANYVNYSLKVTTRRNILSRTLLNITGNYSEIENGTKKTIHELTKFGFCRIDVEVTVEAEGIGPITETAKGFVILRFTRLRRFF